MGYITEEGIVVVIAVSSFEAFGFWPVRSPPALVTPPV